MSCAARDPTVGLRRPGVWIALTGAYALVVAFVSPRYEVPQNDDWAYLETLRLWFETGRLQHIGWNDPTLVFQLWWGTLFAKLLGLDYTSLRLSTLVLSWVGAVSLYGILRELQLPRAVSLLGAGTMLFNPVYLVLSYSFNTDVPYVAMATASTWLVLRVVDRPLAPLRWAAGIALACSFLIRQQALALAAGSAAGIWLAAAQPTGRHGSTGRRVLTIAPIVLPILLSLVAYEWWHRDAVLGGWPPRLNNGLLILAGPSATHAAFAFLRDGFGILLDLGILVAPVALAALGAGAAPFEEQRFLRWCLPALILLLAGVSAWFAVQHRGWPYVGNYLTRHGSLPFQSRVAYLPDWTWGVFTVVAPIGAGWLVAAALALLPRARRDPIAWKATLVLVLGLLQFLPSLALASVYDRYLLPVLPGVVTVGSCWGRGARSGRGGMLPGVLGLLLLAAFSVEWLRVYVERSRARWEVAEALVSRGVPASNIDAGFEWRGSHFFLDAVRVLGVHPPFDLEAGYPWDPLVTNEHVVAEWRPEMSAALSEKRAVRGFFTRQLRLVGVPRPRMDGRWGGNSERGLTPRATDP